MEYFVGFLFIIGMAVTLATLKATLRICKEWERKVVLRLGWFGGIRGPGLFFLLPYIETTPYTIDMRTVTSNVTAEQTLTRDNVPVNVDTIVYWRVIDPKLAALEVADYNAAVLGAAQTALRDIIGRKNLSEVLSDRSGLDKDLTTILDHQTEPWGIKVNSVQMRDIKIPDMLQHAMSLVAQADREGQARKLLGQSEVAIAEQFASASKIYENNPMALQLRGMNMLYEVMKTGGTSTVIVPSHAVESMSLGGLAGLTALSQEAGLKKGIAGD